MSVLDKICKKKREHVEVQKSQTPLSELKRTIQIAPEPLSFINKIKNETGTAIIAEVKKASPSQGALRKNFDPVKIAKTYKDNDATCLSILTDEPYFQGCDQYLRDIKAAVPLPALRKDFMIDPYQIYESRALGADCVLLIMAALNDEEASNLYNLGTDLGMDVLIEVHDLTELDRALDLSPSMIGINNRNLKTLKIDIQTSVDLYASIPDNIVTIAESGIENRQTIDMLERTGFDGFLIGTSLIRSPDIGDALKKMRARP